MAAQSVCRTALTTAGHSAAQTDADLDAKTVTLAADWMDWRLGVESELLMVALQAAATELWKDGDWGGHWAARRDDLRLAGEKEHKTAVLWAF